MIIESCGMTCDIAENSNDAMVFFKKRKNYLMVITDLYMPPNLNGDKLSMCLREGFKFKGVIILITGSSLNLVKCPQADIIITKGSQPCWTTFVFMLQHIKNLKRCHTQLKLTRGYCKIRDLK